MTRAEVRREKERLERAFAFVQRRLGLTLDLLLESNRDIDMLCVGPTNRGVEDPHAFLVGFNPDTVHALSTYELRQAALHELLHAWQFPFWEAATANLQRKVKDHIMERYWEPLVYEMERKLSPWVLRRRP